MSSTTSEPHDLAAVIDSLREAAKGREEVDVDVILDAFDSRLFGPLIVVPALFMVSPLGAIPVVPTILASFILLVTVQHLFGRTHPWLPGLLRERSVEQEKVDRALDKMRPWAERIDHVIKPRLDVLASKPAIYVTSIVIVLMAALVPLLEIVPFAVFLPGATILMLGLAMTARDGLLALIGFALGSGAIWLALSALVF